MAQKELIVRTIVVSQVDGIRIEREWDAIPETERVAISKTLADRFMKEAGYSRVDGVEEGE